MKLFILKKSVKEGISERTGNPYKISSLFVKFNEKEIYEKIVEHLKGKGATIDQIERFCKPNEYNGEVSYSFGLNCSNYTFDRVEQFGTLDANVVFDINDAGFINAKIQVKDRKEMVNSYEPPLDAVDGWTGGNEPTAASTSTFEKPSDQVRPPFPSEEPIDDLPF